MHKKLRLSKQTLRRLNDCALTAVQGGQKKDDDGTNSGYPPCLSYYGSCVTCAQPPLLCC